MAGGRHRRPSAEELALWRSVTETVSPNPRRADDEAADFDPASGPGAADGIETTAVGAAAGAGNSRKTGEQRGRAHRRIHKAAPGATPKSPGKADSMPTPRTRRGHLHGVDRTVSNRMRRGEIEIEARLDLHGMTQVQAHSALRAFITASQAAGHRTVLVITGKGGPRADDSFSLHGQRGVLRDRLPHWLSQPDIRPNVVSASAAHRRHGGDGAFYIYLRRVRAPAKK